jgi:hypothetical protein
MFKWMKILGISLGSLFCLFYFAFLISESSDPVLAIIFGMPFIAWPFVAWKWPKIGAVSLFVSAGFLSWIFLMSSLFMSVGAGVAGFVFLALLPCLVIGALLIYYWHLEGV